VNMAAQDGCPGGWGAGGGVLRGYTIREDVGQGGLVARVKKTYTKKKDHNQDDKSTRKAPKGP